MKIPSLAKAVLFPLSLIPLSEVKGDTKPVQTNQAQVSTNTLTKEHWYSALSTLNPNPISKLMLSIPSTIEESKYKINEIITDKSRMSEGCEAYYGVDTKGKARFYVVLCTEARTDSMLSIAYEQDQFEKGNIFPRSNDPNTPVAWVDAKKAGLDGVFLVYEKNNTYEVKYQFSSLIVTPKHSYVNPNYLINLQNELVKLPRSIRSELSKSGKYVLIAKNVEDAYYAYYPSWRAEDKWKGTDPTRPVYEFTKTGWRDNRKHANTGGLYVENYAIIPQTYTIYGTNTLYDYSNNKAEIRRVLFHELGHAFDDLYSSRFSDTAEFKATHSADIKKFSSEKKEKFKYFYNSTSELFAELFSSLFEGSPNAKDLLEDFPKSAEHIRQSVLPRYGVDISVDHIRKNIYPDYLKSPKDKGKTEIQKVSSLITIPDFPQEYMMAMNNDRRLELPLAENPYHKGNV